MLCLGGQTFHPLRSTLAVVRLFRHNLREVSAAARVVRDPSSQPTGGFRVLSVGRIVLPPIFERLSLFVIDVIVSGRPQKTPHVRGGNESVHIENSARIAIDAYLLG